MKRLAFANKAASELRSNYVWRTTHQKKKKKKIKKIIIKKVKKLGAFHSVLFFYDCCLGGLP